MGKIAFDSNMYLKMQADHILERIKQFDNKLYLEFGGKLFDDYHASRVLLGFLPDAKVRMLSEIKNKTEFIIVANAKDIQSNKLRSDNGITYESEVLRLIKTFKSFGISGSVVVTIYISTPVVDAFITKLTNMGYPVYKHYQIVGYPYDTDFILSDEGFGKNEFVKTTKPLVIVTAPGPGSGKMATCMSQLYNEFKNGVKAGYAKYETFPIWNLPLKHPVNLAYEAATADLNDVNMIDPFHLEAYGVQTVNYNRDIEVFPVVKTMFEKIYGESPYMSPTDMGVNMAGNCIVDNDAACEASMNEIIRRYYDAVVKVKLGKFPKNSVEKITSIMRYLNISPNDRICVSEAHAKEEKTGKTSFAMKLNDGYVVTGKESKLLSAPSACFINALKHYAGIPKKIKLISSVLLSPIIDLKINKLDRDNSNLHLNELLVVLAVSATTNPLAAEALEFLDELKGTEAHSTKIVDMNDMQCLKKLLINVTEDPVMD